MFELFQRSWALHNPLKSWTLTGLNLRECRLLVASMSDAETKVSWVHYKSWSEWKPLSGVECRTLFTYKDSDQHNLPPIPEMQQDEDHEITEVRSLEASPKFREPIARKFTRFIARLPVDILVGNYSFSTHTLDMSEGGFFFEDPLPEWVAGYFTVALKAPDRSFEFTCVLAEDQKKEKYRTEIAPTTTEEALQSFKEWLEEQSFPKKI